MKIITTCEGTGRAVASGELGEADVVMVHSIPDGLKAVANVSFINRRYIMYNYFVIVGPESDPAGIKNASNASDDLRSIWILLPVLISSPKYSPVSSISL